MSLINRKRWTNRRKIIKINHLVNLRKVGENMANTVEVTVKGIDETTKVFRKIEGSADKAFSNIESAMSSIPDLDVDANVDTGRAESNLAGIESAVSGAEGSIKSMSDPKIDGSKAEQELEGVGDAAEDAQDSIDGIDIGSVLGGVAAGGGLAGAVSKAMDVSSIDTQIEISMNIPKESVEAVKNSIKTVETYGVDAEGAMEGVRKQFALNADASDESNQKIIKGAGAISAAFSGVDFSELIQETNEIAGELDISDEKALALTNNLIKVGFPPGEIDTIAEYGKQLADAGYDAEDIQGIMAAGVETETWSIDNLMDGLKEGKILLGEFGTGVDDATAGLLKKTSISSDQLQTWGASIAKGGDKGKQAMHDVASALDGVKDGTVKNQLGVKMFGTMYEDQGSNITDALLNAEGATKTLAEGQKDVNDSVSAMDANPAVQMKQAMSDLNTTLAPLYKKIAKVVSTISTWVSENPMLTATIAAIAVSIGIITGAIMLLTPVVSGVRTAMMLFNTTMLANPIVWIIIGIVALIAIIVLLWKNWDSVSAFLASSWEWIKQTATTVFNGLVAFFKVVWNIIKVVFMTVLNVIKTIIMTVFNVIKTVIMTIWNGIKAFFSLIWQGIIAVVTIYINIVKTIITTVFNIIKTVITTIWNVIKTVTSTVWNAIVSVVTGIINGFKVIITTVFNAIKTVIKTVWDTIKSVSSTVWDGIVAVVTGIIETFKTGISNIFNAIKSVITTVWETIKSVSKTLWDGISETVGGVIEGISSTVSTVFNTIKDTIKGVWESIKSTTSSIWEGIVSAVKAPINGIIGLINGMINAINGISIDIPKIPDWIPGIGGSGGGSIGFNIPNVPSLATGGVMAEPTLAMVGDAGRSNPEIVAPQNMISGIIARELGKYFSNIDFQGGGGQPQQIIVPVIIDGKEVARVTAPHMDRQLGRRRFNKGRAEGG